MRGADTWRDWLESFVSVHFGDELVRAVEGHLSIGIGGRIELEEGDAVIFDRRARRLGAVTAVRVHLEGHDEPFDGNFLADGPHWEPVNEALAAVARASADEPVAAAGLHQHLPEGTHDELQSAALAATRRIRHDRTRVFAHDVRIDIGRVSLILSPLTVGARPLEVPFAFSRYDGRKFSGGIQLALTHEPLRCTWNQSSDPETLAVAWTMALAAYADLTCPSVRANSPDQGTRATPQQRSSPQQRRHRHRTPGKPRTDVAAAADPAALPLEFRPVGTTARFMASYVAGHRRRLQPGQEHSAEAAANAAAVQISLRAHETWVQPHVRGVPSDAVLHFAWAGPDWARHLA